MVVMEIQALNLLKWYFEVKDCEKLSFIIIYNALIHTGIYTGREKREGRNEIWGCFYQLFKPRNKQVLQFSVLQSLTVLLYFI